jgi:16S rRNA (guanine966-N2)-methyltransferase
LHFAQAQCSLPFMRITGGIARSIPLHCPKGSLVRPATDRMREAVFSSLAPMLEGCTVLDLFAGTGSYALEAWSRGARSGCLVEKDRQAIQAIQRNLESVGKSIGASTPFPFEIRQADVFDWVEKSPNLPFAPDLVFIDPPYRDVEGRYHGLLQHLSRHFGSRKQVHVVLETPRMIDVLPTGYTLLRHYGKGREDSRCLLLRWTPDSIDATAPQIGEASA